MGVYPIIIAMDLSLYIHIPFCRKKCLYCDFASFEGLPASHDAYVGAVVREMELRAGMLAGAATVSTVYMGGGTPSLLEPGPVGALLEAAGRCFILPGDAEITLEVNPGTVTFQSLAGYRSAGINRLSVGVQSLDDAMLAMLGRIHTADEARTAVSLARGAGFDNLGIDLIHSLPGQALDHWENTLRDAVSLGPEHLSVYGLSLEEGTPLWLRHEKGELTLPDEETSARMYETAMDLLPAVGYEQYEIANFSRAGRCSRHNLVYWDRGNYLGLGAAAHSFLNSPGYGRRWRNPHDIREYCRLISDGILPAQDMMELSRRDAMGETLFLGLRCMEGVDTEAFRALFGVSIADAFPGVVERHLANGLLTASDGRLRLSRRGLLLANRVFADFV